MKNLILLLSIFFITSCQTSKKSQEQSNPTESVEMKAETPVALGTIVDVAVSNSDFSTLVVALKAGFKFYKKTNIIVFLTIDSKLICDKFTYI